MNFNFIGFKIIAICLLIIEGLGGAYGLAVGLEWIKIIPDGLEKVDKTFFALVGGGIILLVVLVGFLLCNFKQDQNLANAAEICN